MSEKMTLAEFYDELNNHDWFHEMSDDHRVWQKGRNNHARLLRLADQCEDRKALMEAYHKWMWNKVSKEEDLEKPERPEE